MEYVEVNVKIPKSIFDNVNRKRQSNKKDWTNVYWFNKGIKEKIDEKNIKITTGSCYNQNTLYKDLVLSNKSKVFDFYKILKSDIKEKNIAVDKIDNRKNNNDKNIKIFNIKNNPFILSFD